MRHWFISILIVTVPTVLIAKSSNNRWFLSYGVPGGKHENVSLGNEKYEFKNALGQECWVTPITNQQNAEERGVVCRIDSKNTVAAVFACWPPYEELKQRSFATSKLKSDAKSQDTADVILTCHKKAPWPPK